MEGEARRRIVGAEWLDSDHIKKERRTTNKVTQTIVRTSVKHIVLECGHKIPCTGFTKIPTHNTYCYDCEAIGEK